jgi:hypothetical protein
MRTVRASAAIDYEVSKTVTVSLMYAYRHSEAVQEAVKRAISAQDVSISICIIQE